jgi:hypothetical protein
VVHSDRSVIGSYLGSQIGSNVGSNVGAQIGSGNTRGSGRDGEARPQVAPKPPSWDGTWKSNPERPKSKPEPSSKGPEVWSPQPQKPAPTYGASNIPSWPPYSPTTPYPANEGKLAVTSVSTKQNQVYCRKYPDTISPDISKIQVIAASGTRLDATCWAISELDSVPGVWLKTVAGCFVHETNVQEQRNFRSTLNECAPAPHWVGTLQSQYQRKDCYKCTSLSCQSQNLGNLPYADLQCSIRGETVQGDRYATV